MTINELHIQLTCPFCKADIMYPIQFRYGYVRLIAYRLGDKIRWDSHEHDIGQPGWKRVVVNGWTGFCPNCKSTEDWDEDYYIFVEDDVIKGAEVADGRYGFKDDDFLLLEE